MCSVPPSSLPPPSCPPHRRAGCLVHPTLLSVSQALLCQSTRKQESRPPPFPIQLDKKTAIQAFQRLLHLPFPRVWLREPLPRPRYATSIPGGKEAAVFSCGVFGFLPLPCHSRPRPSPKQAFIVPWDPCCSSVEQPGGGKSCGSQRGLWEGARQGWALSTPWALCPLLPPFPGIMPGESQFFTCLPRLGFSLKRRKEAPGGGPVPPLSLPHTGLTWTVPNPSTGREKGGWVWSVWEGVRWRRVWRDVALFLAVHLSLWIQTCKVFLGLLRVASNENFACFFLHH